MAWNFMLPPATCLTSSSARVPNQRTDAYGGSIENRIRFVAETLAAMIAAAGSPGKVGMKVSPGMDFNDIQFPDPMPTYMALAKAIAPLHLAYLHADENRHRR